MPERGGRRRRDAQRLGDLEPSPVAEDRRPLDQAYADAMRQIWHAYPTNADVAGGCAVAGARAGLAELRRPDAALTLATAHATKGLEWDHVAVLGMTEGRFPSARSLVDAADPARALEEERRLAYVAWTRARRSLTLVFDPAAPSRFLLEAFEPAELGYQPPD